MREKWQLLRTWENRFGKGLGRNKLFAFLNQISIPECNGTKLDDDIREEFLEAHNYHRSRVARGLYVAKDKILPQSSDMIQLVGDRSQSTPIFAPSVRGHHVMRKNAF